MTNEVTQTRTRKESPNIGGTILKLVILSLLVGLAMSFFDITPKSIIENFGDSVVKAYNVLTGWVTWMGPYIALGASIVIPIWAVLTLIKMFGGRKKD
ncbi:MAG: hypothetical protein HWE30_05780 [Methylocystaceae bacterium]|nr:hypothetical protein [Methylocystaceae bacterium]